MKGRLREEGRKELRMEHVGSGMSAGPCGPEADAMRVGRVRGEAALQVILPEPGLWP